MSVLVTTTPVYEAADATSQKVFTNTGSKSVLYATKASNLPNSPTGTLTAGATLTATQGYYFATSSGQSALNVTQLTLREELSSGYDVVRPSKEANYTLEADDDKVLILVPAPGESKTATVTVPTNATAAIPLGADVQVWKVPAGLGTVKIAFAEGVTILFGGTALTEAEEVKEQLFLLKVAANEWLLRE